MRWIVTAEPSFEPVTLDQARKHLLVTDTARDEEIARKIRSARQHVENECELALMPQEWLAVYDGFPCGVLLLPGGKVREVVSIQSMDADGVFVTVPAADYDQDLAGRPARVRPVKSWPSIPSGRLNSVKIALEVGWPDAVSIPQPLIDAMLLVLGDLFENLQAQQTEALALNPTLDALTRPYRRFLP